MANRRLRESAASRPEQDRLKEMARAYEGKSDGELLRELKKSIAQGKKDGTVTQEGLDQMLQSVAPLLDASQKEKLKRLTEELNK